MSASDRSSRRANSRSPGQRSTGDRVPGTNSVSNGEARPPPTEGHLPRISLATDLLAVIVGDRRFKRLSLSSEGKKLEAQLTGAQMKLLSAVFTATGSRAEAAWKTVMRDMPQRARIKS